MTPSGAKVARSRCRRVPGASSCTGWRTGPSSDGACWSGHLTPSHRKRVRGRRGQPRRLRQPPAIRIPRARRRKNTKKRTSRNLKTRRLRATIPTRRRRKTRTARRTGPGAGPRTRTKRIGRRAGRRTRKRTDLVAAARVLKRKRLDPTPRRTTRNRRRKRIRTKRHRGRTLRTTPRVSRVSRGRVPVLQPPTPPRSRSLAWV
mmetsp:Transcript_89132/g.255200  ORF Transcript_89132/g.255200 Transcript_89132/m.255200 type:complete len:203 (+) Transcript_89132:722-1330(+)